MRHPHPTRRAPLERRRPVEGSNVVAAIVCIATALVLYFATAEVWDFDRNDFDEYGVFVSSYSAASMRGAD